MASTKDVLEHHLKSFGEGDLKGILSDYAPGAVLMISNDSTGYPDFQASCPVLDTKESNLWICSG